MSRRDTIILSILVNAGLLMLLFATAIRSPSSSLSVPKIHVAKAEKKSAEKPHKTVEVAKSQESQELVLEDFLQTPPPTKVENELVDEIVIPKNELPKAIAVDPNVKSVVEEIAPNCVTVTVKKGDFLEKIAKAHNTTVAAIMRANKMTSANIRVGQVLNVPISETKPVDTASTSESDYYVVKEGDNPWLIASKNRIRLDDLLKINGLDEAKARKLRPGDRLKIR